MEAKIKVKVKLEINFLGKKIKKTLIFDRECIKDYINDKKNLINLNTLRYEYEDDLRRNFIKDDNQLRENAITMKDIKEILELQLNKKINTYNLAIALRSLFGSSQLKSENGKTGRYYYVIKTRVIQEKESIELPKRTSKPLGYEPIY